MSRNYYVLGNGRIQRENNTLYVVNPDGEKKPLPVENVDSLYLYGEVDLNTRFLNFLSQRKIPLHVFNYYGFYAGSYYPREYLHSGFLLVHQVAHYGDADKRAHLARELVRASAHSLNRNLSYYDRRGKGASETTEPSGEIGGDATVNTAIPTDETAEAVVDAGLTLPLFNDAPGDDDHSLGALDTPPDPFHAAAVLDVSPGHLFQMTSPPPAPVIDYDTGEGIDFFPDDPDATVGDAKPLPLAQLRATIDNLSALANARDATGDYAARDVNVLRGLEGKMRVTYYQAWEHILADGWSMTRRVRRPPNNEVNALVSFGNSHLYTVCLSEIYRTQLTPTISYLHEPGARRFSLALDLSEIFKPLIVDRAIFRLINTGQMKKSHFDRTVGSCLLNETGRKLFIGALEERLGATIRHRRLGRHVSYRHLIRLECYKLIRHLTGVEPYRAFRAWW